MMDTSEIIMEYACPAIGIVISNWMFAAPFNDLRQAIRVGDLGDLNPTPWAVMLGNCFGWIAYGILRRNFWIYFGNAFGFCLSVWLNMGAVKLQYKAYWATQWESATLEYLKKPENDKSKDAGDGTVMVGKDGRHSFQKDMDEIFPKRTTLTADGTATTMTLTAAPAPHERFVMLVVFVWISCISFIGFANNTLSQETKQLIVGIVVNLNLVFFYGAPLSTIYTVLRTRSSASIHIMTMIANTSNGTFWCIYGLAILDPFVFVPNGMAVMLGAIQIVLVVVFPRKAGKPSQEEIDLNDTVITDFNSTVIMNEAVLHEKKQSDLEKDDTSEYGADVSC